MKGCNDHGCLVAKPAGMGSNGRCRCPEWKLHAVIKRTRNENERLRGYFDKYAKHRNDEYVFCDKFKHSDYPCTCGFEEARQALDNK